MTFKHSSLSLKDSEFNKVTRFMFGKKILCSFFFSDFCNRKIRLFKNAKFYNSVCFCNKLRAALILGEGRVKGPVRRVQCNHLNFFLHIAAALENQP